MARDSACIITKNGKVLIGKNKEQHRDIISNNNLQRDEDIIGYFDFYLPNLFVPNRNYYLYDELLCDEIINNFDGGSNE